MPTQEERLAELERKVAAIELRRLYDERKAAENTPSEQAYNYSEINHNLAMPLGIATGQEHAIRLIQGDVKVMQDDLGTVKDDLGIVKEHLSAFEQGVNTSFETLESHLNSFEQKVNSRFEEQDKKFDDLGRLLLQVLDRLPPS